ncbi:MAG: hypothetical protein ACFE0P_04805 [Oceanicaulis sp.]
MNRARPSLKAQARRLSRIAAALLAALALAWLGHLIAGAAGPLETAGGLAVLFGVIMTGYAAGALAGRLPDIFWISMVAMAAGLPVLPGSEFLLARIEPLSITATMTPILAFAALGITGKDLRLFRGAGPAFIVISLLVFTGTFLASLTIASFVLFLLDAFSA